LSNLFVPAKQLASCRSFALNVAAVCTTPVQGPRRLQLFRDGTPRCPGVAPGRWSTWLVRRGTLPLRTRERGDGSPQAGYQPRLTVGSKHQRIYHRHGQDADCNRGAARHADFKHVLRGIDLLCRNECYRVAGQHCRIGPITVQSFPAKTQIPTHTANAARIRSLACEKRPAIAIDAVTPTTVASNRKPALSSA